MTTSEFLERLKKVTVKHALTWEEDGTSRIRARSAEENYTCCPISACNPDGPASVGAAIRTADLLGLESAVREAILFAADSPSGPLRRELEIACGMAT